MQPYLLETPPAVWSSVTDAIWLERSKKSTNLPNCKSFETPVTVQVIPPITG